MEGITHNSSLNHDMEGITHNSNINQTKSSSFNQCEKVILPFAFSHYMYMYMLVPRQKVSMQP